VVRTSSELSQLCVMSMAISVRLRGRLDSGRTRHDAIHGRRAWRV